MGSLSRMSGVGALDNETAVATPPVVHHDIHSMYYPSSVRSAQVLVSVYAAPVAAPLGHPPPPLASSGVEQLRVPGSGPLDSASSALSPTSLLFFLPPFAISAPSSSLPDLPPSASSSSSALPSSSSSSTLSSFLPPLPSLPLPYLLPRFLLPLWLLLLFLILFLLSFPLPLPSLFLLLVLLLFLRCSRRLPLPLFLLLCLLLLLVFLLPLPFLLDLLFFPTSPYLFFSLFFARLVFFSAPCCPSSSPFLFFLFLGVVALFRSGGPPGTVVGSFACLPVVGSLVPWFWGYRFCGYFALFFSSSSS